MHKQLDRTMKRNVCNIQDHKNKYGREQVGERNEESKCWHEK